MIAAGWFGYKPCMHPVTFYRAHTLLVNEGGLCRNLKTAKFGGKMLVSSANNGYV